MNKLIDNYTIKDATHLLRCKKGNGDEYWMNCIPISEPTKDGNVKVIVFGRKDKVEMDYVRGIRHVKEDRLLKRPTWHRKID